MNAMDCPAGQVTLAPGNVIDFSGVAHVVKSVNDSGARVAPLNGGKSFEISKNIDRENILSRKCLPQNESALKIIATQMNPITQDQHVTADVRENNRMSSQRDESYEDFLARKAKSDIPTGFEPRGLDLKRKPFDFQNDIVNWAIRRGRAALFEDCGLGKTGQQLMWAEEVHRHTKGNVLILTPLAVADQTVNEGLTMGIEVHKAAEQSQVKTGLTVTNYQKLHRFDPSQFSGVVLDESSILKSLDGKTRTELIAAFRRTPFKLACTATPAPNDYMELGNHAEFLGVMSREEMLATFFTHDGGDTAKWRLKGHAESAFWKWLCSWSVNIRRPSDLGYEDGDFKLPPLKYYEHIVESEQKMDGFLFALPASSLEERREARKASLSERVAMASKLINSSNESWLIWCNLNNESQELTKQIDGAVELTGGDSDEKKEQVLRDFLDGKVHRLVSKPSIIGHGINAQQFNNAMFVGLNDSWEQFYQAVRREWRFGQRKTVHVHMVISNLEGTVLANLKRKEMDAQRMAEEMVKHMSEISSKEIRGVCRETLSYHPQERMILPAWLSTESTS